MDMPRISMTTGCLQGNRAWVQVYRVLIFEESEVRNNNHCTRLYGVPIQRDTERWQYNRARKSRRIRFPNSHLASGRCLSSVILQVHDRNPILFSIRDWGINKAEEQGYALRQGCIITLYSANDGRSEPAQSHVSRENRQSLRLSSLL